MSSGQPHHVKATIAANIRAARDAKGLTQRELARLAGDVDPLQVSRWERGLHRPSDTNVYELAKALDRDFAWFYTDHTKAAA